MIKRYKSNATSCLNCGTDFIPETHCGRYCDPKCHITHMRTPEPTTGCWFWKGTSGLPGDYGNVRVAGSQKGPHRYSYETYHGPIPKGMVVRHKCDRPGCVNPQHLEVGTPRDNTQDMIKRGRRVSGKLPVHEGETHPNAITRAVAEAIASDTGTLASLAAKHGVSKPTDRRIRNGDPWSMR